MTYETGAPGKIREAVRLQDVDLVVSEELLAEYRRALGYPRAAVLHRLSREEIAQQVAGIRHIAAPATLGPIPRVVPDDLGDDMVLATAVAGEAEHIVSGDQDLLRIGSYQGIQILPPAAFLALPSER